MKRIGIDVGGTNTDAVLLDGEEIIAATKTVTTGDITSGVEKALSDVLMATGVPTSDIDAVMIGTTHFTNAVVERRHLTPVAAVRIGLPASASLPPFCDWPRDLSESVAGTIEMIAGGHEYDGREIVPFDEAGMRDAAKRIGDAGHKAVAVSSVFSPLTGACEERAATIIAEEIPGAEITLSHTLGRIGLLERENVALLNAALVPLARRTVAALNTAAESAGLRARLFLTQNDGTVMRADVAERFPVYSFASGPTNSMRGAAFLTGLDDAIVIDVGGTTTDIGYLRHGFPREANNVVEVGGVRTLFRMPDLISLGLGGGSLVGGTPLRVGPESTGYRLTELARIFGGDELTATDIAVAAGLLELGDTSAVAGLSDETVSQARRLMRELMEEGVDRIKTEAGAQPLIAVGGGAFLVPTDLPGTDQVIHPEHAGVANAVGAAIAQVSAEVDRIYQGLGREEAIAVAQSEANEKAIEFGAAAEGLRTVEVEDLPIAYLPGDSLRTRVRVIGDIE
jgi:N-methylhydantoinase A/oxoprolinase/acetone carboxylase beta subunit